jgi:hypothetical protein
MKKIGFVLFLAGAALFGQNTADLIPLQVGNQWVYEGTGRVAGEPLSVRIEQASQFGGRTYFRWSGMDGSHWIRADADGSVYRYDETSQTERIVIAPEGVVTPFNNDCQQIGRVTDTNAEYRGPLGTYRGGVVEVRYGPGVCADAGIEKELYIPFVGLVQRTVTTIAGPVTYDLVYARIGDVTVVTGQETSFTVALDSSSYEVLSRPRVRMALRHKADQPLKLEFLSGQEFDIVIWNQRGERVYVWSADKLFPQVVHTIEVLGERNWTALANLNNLPPGTYTLEAFLTNSGPGRYAGMVTFQVTGPEPAR